jgi:hypothetical protein
MNRSLLFLVFLTFVLFFSVTCVDTNNVVEQVENADNSSTASIVIIHHIETVDGVGHSGNGEKELTGDVPLEKREKLLIPEPGQQAEEKNELPDFVTEQKELFESTIPVVSLKGEADTTTEGNVFDFRKKIEEALEITKDVADETTSPCTKGTQQQDNNNNNDRDSGTCGRNDHEIRGRKIEKHACNEFSRVIGRIRLLFARFIQFLRNIPKKLLAFFSSLHKPNRK